MHVLPQKILRDALSQPVNGLNGVSPLSGVYLRGIYLAPYQVARQFTDQKILPLDFQRFKKVARVVNDYREIGSIIGEYRLVHRQPPPYGSFGQFAHHPPFQHHRFVQRRIANGLRRIQVDVITREMIQQVIDGLHAHILVKLAFLRTHARKVHHGLCKLLNHSRHRLVILLRLYYNTSSQKLQGGWRCFL